MDLVYRIQSENRVYAVVDDLSSVYRALIIGQIEDEITAGPLTSSFTVRPDLEGLRVKTLDNGLFCLGGFPEVVFRGLGQRSYTVNLFIEAAGYREIAVAVNVPQQAIFPLSAPWISLRRLPVNLRGRVVEDTVARNPIPGAQIQTIDSHRNPADPPLSEHMVALRTPLHFRHDQGGIVQACSLGLTGDPKQLEANAPAGTGTLALDNRVGLGAGVIIRIGPEIYFEYGVIASVAPGDPQQPGELTLRSRLQRSYAAGSEVSWVTAVSMGQPRNLTRAADAGDGFLMVDRLLNSSTLKVDDPNPEFVEYHILGALTDAQGYYRLDGISGAPTVQLQASAPNGAAKTIPWTINFGPAVNVIDFRL